MKVYTKKDIEDHFKHWVEIAIAEKEQKLWKGSFKVDCGESLRLARDLHKLYSEAYPQIPSHLSKSIVQQYKKENFDYIINGTH